MKSATFDRLEVRRFEGEQWPERRVSLSCLDTSHAVMISPRFIDVDLAQEDAEAIAEAVNYHDRLVEHLRNAIDVIDNLDGTMYVDESRKLLAELSAHNGGEE